MAHAYRARMNAPRFSSGLVAFGALLLGACAGSTSSPSGVSGNESDVRSATPSYVIPLIDEKGNLLSKYNAQAEEHGLKEIPDTIEDIKANIQHLHERILGERLEIDDPEIERTYQVFLGTWKEGVDSLATMKVNPWLQWPCLAYVNPNTLEEIPEADRLVEDPNYTVRAWMAVITYLLSDYTFLYE